MRPRRTVGLTVLTALALGPGGAGAQAHPTPESTMKRLTPVIFVDEIEPCLSFWTDTLGFEQTMEVPAEDGTRLGFVAFQRGSAEVMYQTMESLAEDIPPLAEEVGRSPIFLFIEVATLEELDRLDEALTAADAPRPIPRRTTFYGADEVVVRDPCGTVVTLAFFGEGEGES